MDKNKLEVNLLNSINTDTLDVDFHGFDDREASLLLNTGIERDGGITNLYENEVEYGVAGDYEITEDARTIACIPSTIPGYRDVQLDGAPAGRVSQYGVMSRLSIEDADDVFIAEDRSYVTCRLVGAAIRLTKYSSDQEQLDQRDIVFANLAAALAQYTSLSFVRYNGMAYEDSMEFSLRLGDQLIILKESDLQMSISSALQTSSVLGDSDITCVIVYNNMLVVAGKDGRVGSYDGSAWKNYDGSGTGTGIYNPGDPTTGVVGDSDITAVCLHTTGPTTYLVVGSADGRVGSYDGSAWVSYTSTADIANNATVVSTDSITCMISCLGNLLVGSASGKLGSYTVIGEWVPYNTAGAGALCDNNTLLVGAINAMAVWTDPDGYSTVVVAGAEGKVGSFKIGIGRDWEEAVRQTDIHVAGSIIYTGDMYVATAKSHINGRASRRVVTSKDGKIWTPISNPPDPAPLLIAYGNGAYVLVAGYAETNYPGTQYIYRSTDLEDWNLVFTLEVPVTADVWKHIRDVAFIDGKFIAHSARLVLTSETGESWQQVELPVSPFGEYTWLKVPSIASGEIAGGITRYVRVFRDMYYNYRPTNLVSYSDDGGATWTTSALLPASRQWSGVAYGNGRFVAVDYYGNWASSETGISGWTTGKFSSMMPGNYFGRLRAHRPIAFTGRYFIVGGIGAIEQQAYSRSSVERVAISEAGVTWTEFATGFSVEEANGSEAPYVIPLGGDKVLLASAAYLTTIRPYISTAWNKHIYSEESTAYFPTNSGTVTGGQDINEMCIHNNHLVVAGGTSASRIGSMAPDGTWYKYDAVPGSGTLSTKLPLISNGFTDTYTGAPGRTQLVEGPEDTLICLLQLASTDTSTCSTEYSISTDNGATWTPKPAIHANTESDEFYISSMVYGGGFFYTAIAKYAQVPADSHAIALYKSADGNTWTEISTPISGTAEYDVALGYLASGNLLLSYTLNNSVYCHISTDAAATWGTAITVGALGSAGDCSTFAIVEGQADKLLMQKRRVEAKSGTYYPAVTLYRSLDGGATWSAAYTEVSANPFGGLPVYVDGVWIITRGDSYLRCTISTLNSWTAYTLPTGTAYIVYPTPLGLEYSVPTGQKRNISVKQQPAAVLGATGGHFVLGSVYPDKEFYVSTDGASGSWRLLDIPLYRVAISAITSKNISRAVWSTPSLASAYYPNMIGGIEVAPAITDAGTLLDTPIISMTSLDSTLVVGGAGGKLASVEFDGTRNAYDSGTGISNNATIISSRAVNALAQYSDRLMVAGEASNLNAMSADGSFDSFYVDADGNVFSALFESMVATSYLYTYRYENGLYLVNLVGNSLNRSYVLDNDTKGLDVLAASHAWLQVSNGYSRHITTASDSESNHIYDETSIKASGLVGYTNFQNFSSSIVYPTADYVLGNGNVLQSQSGFAYGELTFQLASSETSIFTYAPQARAIPTALYSVWQSNTDTLVNGYAKLTNNIGVAPSVPFEIRTIWINGTQAALSVAMLDELGSDTVGTLLTSIGELDESYTPMIVGDRSILFANSNGGFSIISIGTAPKNIVQKISPSAYKLNTISPLNILDTDTGKLLPGSLDYNGRALFSSSVDTTTVTKVANIINSKYSSSVDVGAKLVTIEDVDTNNVQLFGYRIPSAGANLKDYSVDTYIDDVYGFSTYNNSSELVSPAKEDLLYLTSTYISPPIGAEYRAGNTIYSRGTTMFQQPGKDAYSIGNDISGEWNTFQLFGSTYLFDGSTVYQAEINSVTGVIGQKVALCSGLGLSLVAVTPAEAYFLSNYDNSLYSFNGGRQLSKFKRMNRLPSIIKGIYSTVDNTTLLESATSFIWIRDGIITENQKKATQLRDLKLYDTKNGIIIGNNTYNWNYSYIEKPGSVVVPLEIQTPYYGFNIDTKSILTDFIITIYNKNKTAMSVQLISYVIDEGKSNEQVVNMDFNPCDYSDDGYVRCRLKPKYARSLGTSLKLSTTEKVLLVSIVPVFGVAENAVIPTARTR